MKLWSKFLGGLAALLLAAHAHAQLLSPSGISADPAASLPGDTVKFTIAVQNGQTAAFGPGTLPNLASASFTIVFTHKITGAQFVIGPVSASPNGGFVPAATTDPTTGVLTPGQGSFTVVSKLPISSLQSGDYTAEVFLDSTANPSDAIGASTFSASSAVVTVGGNPDLQITSLQYPSRIDPSGNPYVGGDVIPMELTYRNNISTNGKKNVPFTPGRNGQPQFVRIHVVLSGNPTFGDIDDQQLTFVDLAEGNLGSRAAATATLSPGVIGRAVVYSGGTGYNAATTTVTISGGGGSGALASAVISAGKVVGITIDNPGSNYTSTPTLSISDSGGGSGATGAAILSAGVASSISISSQGSGYVQPPTVIFYGGGGAGAEATATINPATGSVTAVNVTSAGSGYSSAPTVLLIGGGGADSIDADGVDHTLRWNQVLPKNFTGSYYVLAKIDSLDALDENDPPVQTVNGNNVWSTNSLNPSGTLITLLAKNAPSTSLVSHAVGATSSANRYSDNPAISADGRFVAFASDASTLVSGDTNNARDIFLFDNQTNLVRRLSLAQQGTEGNGASQHPAISDLATNNHYYIAFESEASNLVSGDTNRFWDIFVVDSVTGGILRASVSSTGAQADQPSRNPSISADGRYVVFESTAKNLVANVTDGRSHIYLRDRCVSGVGAFDVAGNTATTIVDVSSAGAVADGDSTQPVISADGTHIAFTSAATNLAVPAASGAHKNVYVRNRSNSTTRLLSTATGGGEGDADSQTPAINEDGHWVAFDSVATNLVLNDTNAISDVFVADTTGATAIVRVSESSAGDQGYDPSTTLPYDQRLGSVHPSISADGRYVTFASLTANLTPGDSVGQYQGAGATATATIAGGSVTGFTVTAPGSKYSQTSPPVVIITGGGSVTSSAIAYARVADDGTIAAIVPVFGGTGYTTAPTVTIASDANRAVDVFVHDRDVSGSGAYDTTGNLSTSVVSTNTFGYQTYNLLGIPSTAASDIYPAISGNGRFIAFPSDADNVSGLAFGATNLLPTDTNTFRDIFLSDQRIAGVASPKDFNPTITITAPGSGTRAVVNRAVTLRASAVATIGHVSTVEFFVDGGSIGVLTTLDPASNSYQTTWTPTATGTYSLSAIVTDNYGDQGVAENVSVIVNAPPTVSVTAPADGSLLGVGNVYTVSARAAAANSGSSITGVEFFANGVSLGTVSTSGTSVTPSISWMPAYAGNYTLTAVATETISGDSYQIQTTSAGVPLSVGSNPAITITTPTTGSSYLVSTDIPIAAVTSGGYGAIARVDVFVNGDLLTTLTAAPYTTTWTPTSAGTYTLSAQVTDVNNHQSASAPFTVTITANQAPTVQLTSPQATTSLVAGDSIALSANADDVDGVVKSVAFVASGKVVGTATAKPFALTWTPGSAGTYSIVARATDDSGNVTTSSPAVTVNVAVNQSPTIAITSPSSGANVKVNTNTTIAATAADSDGTIASVRFYVNGVAIGSADTTAPYAVSWKPAATGTYRLTAVATDGSGASTTSSTVTVLGVSAAQANTTAFYSGQYQNGSERGTFAVANIQGYSAVFIAYAQGAAKVYYFDGMSVGSDGSFSKLSLRGTFGASGVNGVLGSGAFIGPVVSSSTTLQLAPGYYTGTMALRHASSVTALIAGNGTIFVHVQDGGFEDAGSGHLSGSGAFSFKTAGGNTLSGKADPATGLMTGKITGRISATFTAAQPASAITADGFLMSANARAQMGTGDGTLTVGVVTGGRASKKLLLRAVGPSGKSVWPSSVRVAADPTLKLYNKSGRLITTNNNWGRADLAVMTRLAATPVFKAGSKDAAMVKYLAPGVYTLQVTGSGAGLARAEVYDADLLDPFATNRLIGLSARAQVGTGSSVLISQFVISGTAPKRVLIRGVGPALLAVDGGLNVLKDPFLRLSRIEGRKTITVREHDSWSTGNDTRLLLRGSAAVGATPGLASGSKDAALLVTLPPGTYSATLMGLGNTTGIGLLQVYELK